MMNAIRVQIHLKHMFDENVSNELYNFWYAFHPSKLRTIKDLLDDLQENYLKPQLTLLTNKLDLNDQQAFLIELDQCQLLPFSSSQILRDNDRLTLTPLTKYKLHKKALQDSINLTTTSVLPVEPTANVSTSLVNEKAAKRQRTESIEQDKTIEPNISATPTSTSATMTTIVTTNQHEENLTKKKKKTTTTINEEPVVVPMLESVAPVQVSEDKLIEKEITSESPPSFPSTAGRLREIKSKTPKWKSQQPRIRENSRHANHIRFDSDNDENEEEKSSPVKSSISIEKSNNVDDLSSSKIDSPATSMIVDQPAIPIVVDPPAPKPKPINTPKETPQKTLDLLFEMKQCKTPGERQAKKIKQEFAKRRAQHRKRAICGLALANYVDQAFGLDRATLEKQISTNENTKTPTTTESLPSSFNKLARLPLIANAIETNDKIYDLYPPVDRCPSIDTRIAFKLLELSEDFCPKLSEFREGTVIDVNSSTGELTLQLDQPLSTVFDQPSKFFAPDEEQTIEESTTVTLPFTELQSVRLVSTTNGNRTELN